MSLNLPMKKCHDNKTCQQPYVDTCYILFRATILTQNPPQLQQNTMCRQISFRLACEHVSTHIRYCPVGLAERRPCANTTKQSIPYPPPSGYTLPKCPLVDCPFEAKNQAWDCCWCGKTWNVGGRCSCVMIGEGGTYRCEHICCKSCMPSREYYS